ncbi:DUF3784 domain-containing protein [Alkalihalobacillus sp. MEB130]|uniref:DUF3784 domain-containing protein n=1 Tax=Alkalihalobacillus sp. MEB130 TaxID=2976704 RepID=UPI0028DDBA98|nr:DUF3784 domain-containing protein [Alkalihalobacillus sp. MEB130]MDT8860811.1 DUF3784 domain-containing protein [Alkalihalobacillus sp. MEB130]
MISLIMIQLFMFLLLFLLGYLIVKKQAYFLLSGFSAKTEEDQQILIKNGYPQAAGRVLMNSSFILLVGLGLSLFEIPYMIELSWLVMIIYLFVHLLYIGKLDNTKHRKRNSLILKMTIVFTFGILGWASYMGLQPNELSISDNRLQISGFYGVEWPLDEITNIELVDTIPKIQVRTNGFSFANRLKGHFRLEELGKGRLFIYRNSPHFIYIEKGDDYIFINSSDSHETKLWYEEMMNQFN